MQGRACTTEARPLPQAAQLMATPYLFGLGAREMWGAFFRIGSGTVSIMFSESTSQVLEARLGLVPLTVGDKGCSH